MKLQVWMRMSNDEIKTIPKHFNEKKAACKTQHFSSLPAFLSITITFFYVDSCQCLLLFDKTSSKTKTVITISRNK